MKKQSRRWAADWTKRKKPFMTEHGVSPNEAGTALVACLLSLGLLLSEVQEYDYRKDKFRVLAYRQADGKLLDCDIPGETVARTVVAARVLGGVKILQRGLDKTA